jgi:predicted RND superfamily exporter protein
LENKKLGRAFIVAALLLTVLCYFPLSNLRFDFSLEKLFPSNDPDLEFFKTYQQRFHTEIDDEYIFIALFNEAGIFQQDFLEKADSLSRLLLTLEDILIVYSLTDIPSVKFSSGELTEQPLIHIDRPDLYAADSANLFLSEEYKGLLFSSDGKTLSVTALNRPGLSDPAKDLILDSLDHWLDDFRFDRAHVAAKIKIERAYVRAIEQNLKRYLAVSFLLITGVLLLLYRSFTGTVIPLVTIAIAVCWTLALVSLAGIPLDIMSSLLPPVIAVICMSDIIHLTTNYIAECRRGLPKMEALSNTVREIGMATFFTSLTTAAGFYSLCTTNVIPIRTFGFFAGTGVMIALLVALGVILATYAHLPVPRIVRRESSDRTWRSVLNGLHSRLEGKRFTIIAVYILLLIPAGLLIGKIQINSSLLQELPRHDPAHDDYAFIEQAFSGTRSFEMALELKDTSFSFLRRDRLAEIEQLEQFLTDSLGVGTVFSPVIFIKGANRALSGGDPADWQLPADQRSVYECFDKLLFSAVGRDMIRYITQDGRHVRIGGKLPNITLKESEALSSRLDRYMATTGASFGFTSRLTGSSMLIDRVSYSVIRNLFIGLAIGFIVVSMIVTMMFRSPAMVVIVLLCNIIPLLFTAAVMGALGIYLKADTAIIFAVSFGIAVDDSIHFINRFRLERHKGRDIKAAVRATFLSTGKAMTITTIILLAGFTALMFSNFGGAFYIGLLVSLCLVFALIVDLTLLPALLQLFIREKGSRQSKSIPE